MKLIPLIPQEGLKVRQIDLDSLSSINIREKLKFNCIKKLKVPLGGFRG